MSKQFMLLKYHVDNQSLPILERLRKILEGWENYTGIGPGCQGSVERLGCAAAVSLLRFVFSLLTSLELVLSLNLLSVPLHFYY